MCPPNDSAEGFEAEDRDLPTPPVGVEDVTRLRLMLTVAAIIGGATPEEVAGYHEGEEFPASVYEALDRPGERDELSAHVDLLLSLVQSPSPSAV